MSQHIPNFQRVEVSGEAIEAFLLHLHTVAETPAKAMALMAYGFLFIHENYATEPVPIENALASFGVTVQTLAASKEQRQ